MGTCAVTIKKRHVGVGASVMTIADVTLSSNYASGGDTLTLGSLGLSTCDVVMLASNEAGYNYKIVQGATQVAAPLVQLFQGDNANAAAAPGVEVSNASNQSGRTIRVVAFGNYGGA